MPYHQKQVGGGQEEDIYRIANGKIVWCRRIPTPDLAFFKQLGVVEYTEKGKKLFPEDVK